jgi:hypothetical protein
MALHDTLNLRREEVTPVSLLLFQSVFLGFFLGAFDVGANTLFLNSFEQSMIPKAIVISGIAGIILTSLYSYFQSRITFSNLAVLNLATVFLLTFLLRAGYYFSDTKWLAFGLFVLMGPLNIVALVGFWGTVGRMFDLRQGKRIFGFIDTGQVLGVIVSSLSIPFLITIGFHTKDLLYISATSIFLAVIIQIVISSKYPSQLKIKVVKAERKSNFMDTFRIPYVRTMAFFVIFSMLVAFFVHYLFLSVASERFQDPDEMAKFFGGLMGSLTIVSVLIKTFVYGPLMKTYGLKISLLISPVIMFLITVGAALVGSAFGYTLESGTFTFFFLLISLSKFFQKALKDSIESPVLKLIYQSLNPGIRHEVQARVDGTINEMAALSSGVVLTLLGFIGFFTLINYTHVLLGIIIIWLYVSYKLFQGYRKTLKETLEKASMADKKVVHKAQWLETIADNKSDEKYNLIELTKPWLLVDSLKEAVAHAAGIDLVAACNKIKERIDPSILPVLKKRLHSMDESEDKVTLTDTIAYIESIEAEADSEELIKSIISSKNYEDRIIAAQYLGASTNSILKKNLTFLLRDLVPAVKKQAIWAARGSRSKEIISFLIDFLDKDFYAPLAHAALINSGEIGLEMLMLAFNRTNATETFRHRIIRIVPETGSAISHNVLFGKLSIHSNLKTAVLDGLMKLDFSTDDHEAVILHQMLIDQAGVCAWNLNMLYHCPPENKAPGLKSELEHNFTISRNNLFQMLKLQYDKSSIDAVVENLEAGTGESISFAIELLDTFVVEDLKPYIFPLLEDASLANKVWALQNYFPLRSYTPEEMLKAIINRNENIITKYAKIYALNAFGNIENLSLSADLTAQLFNTDRVLRQLSAQIVANIDQQQFLGFKKRLNDKLRVELDRMLEMTESVGSNAIDRLSFYRSTSTNDKFLAPLFWLYHAGVVKVTGMNIFEMGLFKNANQILLIETGELTLMQGNQTITTFSEGDIVVTNGLDPSANSLVVKNSVIIHFVDFAKFEAELYDNDFLTEYITKQFAIH